MRQTSLRRRVNLRRKMDLRLKWLLTACGLCMVGFFLLYTVVDRQAGLTPPDSGSQLAPPGTPGESRGLPDPNGTLTPRAANGRENNPRRAQLTETFPEGLAAVHYEDIDLSIDNVTSAIEAETKFDKFVFRQHVRCAKTVRLGRAGDGGWDMCLVGPYSPSQPCLVYSFGINYDWSFDDDVAEKFGCTVRSFDPSMRIGAHQRNKTLRFYPVGLGGSNGMDANLWPLKTLGTLMGQLDDQSVLDYVKFDIEYAEWDSLEAMFKENVLSRVKQMGFEIHTKENQGRTTTPRDLQRYMRILRGLEDRGFRKWYVHFNSYGIYKSKQSGHFRTCCYELVYINLSFLKPEYGAKLAPLNIPGKVEGKSPNISKGCFPEDGCHMIDDVNRTVNAARFKLNGSDIQLYPGFQYIDRDPDIPMTYSMTGRESEEVFYRYIRGNQIKCPHHVRVGNRGDGGWDVCLAKPYLMAAPCLIYSFGIGGDWSFDKAGHDDFGCDVRSFDPSLSKEDLKKIPAEKIDFYQIGLGTRGLPHQPKTWKMKSLKETLQMTGDFGMVLDVLKIDVEYAEWDAINAMFIDGTLKWVKQLVFELHTREVGSKDDVTNTADFVFFWRILQNLESLGFRRWHANPNNAGRYVSKRSGMMRTCCYELYYINLNYMVAPMRDTRS